MPFYIIHHSTPLSKPQCAAIASHITTTHSERFTAPRHFVNVKFEYQDPAIEPPTYVGGKPRRTNYIFAHVRDGGSRTAADFNGVAAEISQFWDTEIAPHLARSTEEERVTGKGAHVPEEERELHAVFMLGDIVGGVEAGFSIPAAGEDVAWIKQNWATIEEKAKGVDPGPGGKEMWVEMIAEVKERKLM